MECHTITLHSINYAWYQNCEKNILREIMDKNYIDFIIFDGVGFVG